MQDRWRAIPECFARRLSPEARSTKLVDQRVLSVAGARRGTAVQDRRLGCGEGEAQVAAQIDELRLLRGMQPIEVETSFAQGDNFRRRGQIDDRLPVHVRGCGGVVGMDTHARIQAPLPSELDGSG